MALIGGCQKIEGINFKKYKGYQQAERYVIMVNTLVSTVDSKWTDIITNYS